MKKIIAICGVCLIAGSASATEFWQFGTSNTLSFSKTGFADVNDPANWDTITDNVAITRGNVQGLYNPIAESNWNGAGPSGTLWLLGNTVQDVLDGTVDISDFTTWLDSHGSNPLTQTGQDMVLYLTAEDIFIDVKFTSWGVGGGSGGSFSYDRATPTPGALGIFGLAGIAATRRRR